MLIRRAEVDGRGLVDVRVATVGPEPDRTSGTRLPTSTLVEPRRSSYATGNARPRYAADKPAALIDRPGHISSSSAGSPDLRNHLPNGLSGRIVEMGWKLEERPGETVIDAAGGALIPGLHDHHIHLFALAAARRSVACGPPEVHKAAALAHALRDASPTGSWIRGVGYHESVAGKLDRWALDRMVADRPLRIQHRSGAMWVLNSKAVQMLGLDHDTDAHGVERDETGRSTGRLFRLDDWLRKRIGGSSFPDLSAVGRLLASFGVTCVTDATVANAAPQMHALVEAVHSGALPQSLLVLGSFSLPPAAHPAVARGAVKVLLDERELPGLETLVETIAAAHGQQRSLAVHCVTRAELFLALAAFAEAGVSEGDRIEHASVTPPEALDLLSRLSLTVVTQPGFLWQRGDAYIEEVAPEDLPWLYRCRAFLGASLALAAGTDAPFGSPDPWLAMRAAVDRCTGTGAVLGKDERLSTEQALALFTTPAESPGAAPRRIAVGEPADLCLLDRPWTKARENLSNTLVRATIRDGVRIF